MGKLPDYVGPCAFGIKMGVITPNCDLLGMVSEAVQQCDRDNFLDDGDVICITESVVARAQNNFVSTGDIAAELREKHNVKADSRLGILFPITSRNRFALILKGFAKAVPQGEVVVQFSFPCDEVGNMIVLPEFADSCEADEIFSYEKIKNKCLHPITKIDYPGYYQEIIEAEGARAKIYFSNNPETITSYKPDCLIISNIHDRVKKHKMLQDKVPRCITLQNICSDPSRPSWSVWGLLGSNMSSDNLLNLAPRDGDAFALAVQKTIKDKLDKEVEVIIYGDGAYKDPVSGIYELADPQPSLGSTMAFKDGRMREGVKYKMLADTAFAEGKSPAEIEEILAASKKKGYGQHEIASEGTTPRKLEDIIASLADLVSGSADAGTPLILVKGLFKER
ncbi:MAG: coenzyme F420-0:L-glutamate ligase [Bacillota bacterium]